VVTIALRTGNTDYAREFIHNYKQALPVSQRTNALAYNLANLHFSEKNFRSAISQLQKVDLDDVFYRLDARSILLKSYYELDDSDALYYHATAFRSMLNRNRKISDQQRKLYLNLIKHTMTLSQASGDGSTFKTIQERITKNPNVADLSWLESKINAL
jgi:lipopolysaccharide biosynthesis regulator YciM